MTFPFDIPTFVIAAAVVAGAYVIFGISAFGAALFTVPVLTHFLPLDFVLPMCALVDMTAAFALGARFSRDADWSELKLMVPLSLAGAIAGVTLLVALPRQATIAGIGVAGFIGGAFGTLFGVGAPPYAVYLTHRLRDKLVFRATLSNMVIFSVSMRVVVFTASGLMLADRVIGFALLVPFALAGLWVGNRIHGRTSRAGLLRVVAALLLLIGLSLLVRALAPAVPT
jgi:uncharacterized membrane protein YfcA